MACTAERRGLTAQNFRAGNAGAGPAVAATPQVGCTSGQAGLTAKLQRDITTALANRNGTIAVGLYDRTTRTTCTLWASSAYDSAGVVKVTVLATLLWDARKQGRYLTQRETGLASAMITRSDNSATSTPRGMSAITSTGRPSPGNSGPELTARTLSLHHPRPTVIPCA